MPVYLVTEDELYHHGILGQQWGVRRFQYKDGSLTPAGEKRYPLNAKEQKAVDKKQAAMNKAAKKGIRDESYRQARTIPAGTTMFRTTGGVDANADGTTYVSYLEVDRNHYNGGWIRQTAKVKNAYEHEFKLKKDLKLPSRDEVAEVINDAVKKDHELVAKTVDTWLTMMIRNNPEMAYYMSIDEATGKYSEDAFNKYKQKCIDSFGKMTPEQSYYYSAQTLGLNDSLKKTVVSELKKRGYNAMTDEASVGGQNGWSKEGMDPLIIFDGADTLDKQKTRIISADEERKSYAKYQQWANKAYSKSGKWSDSSDAYTIS